MCKQIHNWESVVDKNNLINCFQNIQFLLEKFHAFSHLKNWKLDLEHLKFYLFAHRSARKHWSFPFKDLIYYLSNGTECNTQLFFHWASFSAEVSMSGRAGQLKN